MINEKLISPGSIVVIGGSDDLSKPGGKILRNIIDGGYSGQLISPGDCNTGTDYGYDAARTPWRIATDYLWWNIAEAKAYMDKVGAWAQGVGADNVVDGYTTSGQATGSNASTVFLGAFAVANMSSGQDTVDTWFAKLIDPRLCQITYYPGALRALYLATGSGAFAVGP